MLLINDYNNYYMGGNMLVMIVAMGPAQSLPAAQAFLLRLDRPQVDVRRFELRHSVYLPSVIINRHFVSIMRQLAVIEKF